MKLPISKAKGQASGRFLPIVTVIAEITAEAMVVIGAMRRPTNKNAISPRPIAATIKNISPIAAPASGDNSHPTSNNNMLVIKEF